MKLNRFTVDEFGSQAYYDCSNKEIYIQKGITGFRFWELYVHEYIHYLICKLPKSLYINMLYDMIWTIIFDGTLEGVTFYYNYYRKEFLR